MLHSADGLRFLADQKQSRIDRYEEQIAHQTTTRREQEALKTIVDPNQRLGEMKTVSGSNTKEKT
jgi:hypothetical protein